MKCRHGSVCAAEEDAEVKPIEIDPENKHEKTMSDYVVKAHFSK